MSSGLPQDEPDWADLRPLCHPRHRFLLPAAAPPAGSSLLSVLIPERLRRRNRQPAIAAALFPPVLKVKREPAEPPISRGTARPTEEPVTAPASLRACTWALFRTQRHLPSVAMGVAAAAAALELPAILRCWLRLCLHG